MIGNGAPTSITTAFGNVTVTRIGDSGSAKGTPNVYATDVEPYISNSGDLTRDRIAKLVEMVIDDQESRIVVGLGQRIGDQAPDTHRLYRHEGLSERIIST
jgi:hypothetical protein